MRQEAGDGDPWTIEEGRVVTIDQFLYATSERLPSPTEFIALCDECGIGFKYDAQGQPSLVVKEFNKEVGILVAKLIKREPWRSEIINRKLGDATPSASGVTGLTSSPSTAASEPTAASSSATDQ